MLKISKKLHKKLYYLKIKKPYLVCCVLDALDRTEPVGPGGLPAAEPLAELPPLSIASSAGRRREVAGGGCCGLAAC